MKIGLPLKRYPAVGAVSSEKPDQPFHKVPQVKKDVGHLFHLPRVDGFMVENRLRDFSLFGRKNGAKQIDGSDPFDRKKSCEKYFHAFLPTGGAVLLARRYFDGFDTSWFNGGWQNQ
jgi:hypothetical protein